MSSIEAITSSQIEKDLEGFSPGNTFKDVPLSELSSWKIGGPLSFLVKPTSLDEVSAIKTYLAERNIACICIGETSNLLFPDEGVRAVAIQIGSNMSRMALLQQDLFQIEAGAWVPAVALKAQRHGLSGIEHICGIPGTLGGLIYMNGGSGRKAIAENIETVTSINGSGQIVQREVDSCEFFYRKSVYQANQEIIVRATIRLERTSTSSEIRKRMLTIMKSRREKFPRKAPSCGSVFKSNANLYEKAGPPGKVIESLGFRGRIKGKVQISSVHANFFVNLGGAKSDDVISLIFDVKDKVLKTYNEKIETEVQYVFPNGTVASLDSIFGRAR